MGVVARPGGLLEAGKCNNENICRTHFTCVTGSDLAQTYPVALAVWVSTSREVGALTVKGLLLQRT